MRKRRSYRDKLHRAFFEIVELNKEFETTLAKITRERDHGWKSLGKMAPSELRDEVARRYETKSANLVSRLTDNLMQIQRRRGSIPFNPLAYNYLSIDPSVPDDKKAIFEYLHWERHGESAENTKIEVEKGDVKALRRLHRTEEDYLQVVAKKEPIKKFQGDMIHRELLEMILCFETKPMTDEERADCADDHCACEETHDAKALGNQYRRLKKQLQASARNSQAKVEPNLQLKTKAKIAR